MRALLFVFSFFVLTAGGGIWSPAAAEPNAREAIAMCDKNPKCDHKTNDNGSVDLTVKYPDGVKYINCPQVGECKCVACRTAGNKGLKANVSSTLTGGVVSNPSGGTTARTGGSSWNRSELEGRYDRKDIATACTANGGQYWSNLDGYGCGKQNCDGKGNECQVICKNNKKCDGVTPARTAGGKTLRHVLGVKITGVASPTRDPSPPRKPSVLTGGNILDGGGGFGPQGPAATGAPMSTGRGSAPPPGKIN